MSNLISEEFRIIAKKWVEADAAANMLEESKSAVLAKMISTQGDIPVNRAETRVKSSDAWSDYIKSMVEAREKASMLKVQLEYIRMRFSEWQSHEANRRAEMKL